MEVRFFYWLSALLAQILITRWLCNNFQIWTFWGQKGALRAKTGPFGVPGGPEEAQYQAKVCGNHVTNPIGPIGCSWDQIWYQETLQGPLGPPKGPFRAKRAFLKGAFGGPMYPKTPHR